MQSRQLSDEETGPIRKNNQKIKRWFKRLTFRSYYIRIFYLKIIWLESVNMVNEKAQKNVVRLRGDQDNADFKNGYKPYQINW